MRCLLFVLLGLSASPELFAAVPPDITGGPPRDSSPIPSATEEDDPQETSRQKRIRQAQERRAARREARRQAKEKAKKNEEENGRANTTPNAGANASANAPSGVTDSTPPANFRDQQICANRGVALGGMDVVSYYQTAGPVSGDPQFSAQHDGLTYYFSRAKHRDQFMVDPGAFLPEYLGWCATRLAEGTLSCPDPDNYKVIDGKLLLFSRTATVNYRAAWQADPLSHRRRADTNAVAFLLGNFD